jgi:putative FmdB family regulatory protein
MPVYEYKCEKCGTRFEVEAGVGEARATRCPSNGCRGKVERVFSLPAIMFKGKGWHSTDYGKGNGRKPSPAACPQAGSCPSGACPAAKGD